MSDSQNVPGSDNTHLEIRMVRKDPPAPPSSNIVINTIVTVFFALIAALAIKESANPSMLSGVPGATGYITQPGSTTEQGSAIELYNYPNTPLPQAKTTLPHSRFNTTSQLQDGSTARVLCSGNHDGVPLRVTPSFSPSAILGIVSNGQQVRFVGGTTWVDGILLYRVMNESELVLSQNPFAQNQLQAKQTGWVTACPQG